MSGAHAPWPRLNKLTAEQPKRTKIKGFQAYIVCSLEISRVLKEKPIIRLNRDSLSTVEGEFGVANFIDNF